MRSGIQKFRKIPKDNSIIESIEYDLKNNNAVLYLKGTKMFPQCGYSAAVVAILDNFGVVYKDIDILSDPVLSKAIKSYTDWPNTPQLYIKGEFIGGCDKVKDLYASGALLKLLLAHNLVN